MRLRRGLSENFWAWAIPLICGVFVLYLGHSGVVGPVGLLAWRDAKIALAMKQSELDRVRRQREALQHRIALMDSNALDADLLEEVARGVLADSRPGEVTVSRTQR